MIKVIILPSYSLMTNRNLQQESRRAYGTAVSGVVISVN